MFSSFTKFALLPFANSHCRTVLALTLGIGLSSFAVCLADTSPTTLKGRVQEDTESRPDGLDRSDLRNPNSDPFSEGEQEVDAPSNMYQMDTPTPSQPPPPLKGNVQGQGQRPLQGMQPRTNPFDGEGEPMPVMQQPMPARQAQQRPPDPDNSPEMQVAWDLWHKRVASAIYTRFNFLAKLAFRHSPPLLCQVGYVVTRDGQIQNIQVQQKSTNVLFNVIVFQTVKSLNGDINLLQFPPGSRRMFVPKSGTFTQNYGGDGFKYTVGDRESLQGR